MIMRRRRDGDEGTTYQEKRADDVELSAFGWTFRFPGRYLTNVILIVMGFGAILYMLREHDINQSTHTTELAAERQVQMRILSKQQGDLSESMGVMIYLLSLPQEERTKLKIDMPQMLRDRLLSSERPTHYNER